jgi:RNA polymerase sigma-70 factor, ECF subfamily
MRRDARSDLVVPSEEADDVVARAVDGDGDAFGALFRATLPVIYRNLYGRSGDQTLAEDLASETFVRALRSVKTFQGGSRDFLAWLLRIARNLFLDHVRSARVRWELVVEELPITVAIGDLETEALGRIEGADLRRVLGRLTPEQQEVVLLRFMEGFSVAEVAVIVGRNEGAVKALQFRAMKSLARLIEQDEGKDA